MRLKALGSSGFTLIELLVVIAIIVILAAILFPVFERAHMRGKQMSCLANLKQLAVASLMYAQDNDGRLPPRQPAFYFALMPIAKAEKLFVCPSDAYPRKFSDADLGEFRSSYGINGYLCDSDGVGLKPDSFPNQSAVPLMADITMHTSLYYFSADRRDDIDRRHNGGANFSFCDAHAAHLKDAAVNSIAMQPDAY